MKKKIVSVFGTRPEAIKMCPLVKGLENDPDLESVVLVTAQHREMLDQVLEVFDVKPDYDMNIMKQNQSLTQITSNILNGIEELLKEIKPDMILVHGDTSTTFAGALAAFYNQIDVGHVEAGLRTFDKWSPFPEEMNRSLTGRIADLHFSPTQSNKNNLLKEGISEEKIALTGNTVIDALKMVISKDYEFGHDFLDNVDFENEKVITMTAHRRENLGEPMRNIFSAIKRLVEDHDVRVIYPIHLNPKVREIANEVFKNMDKVHLIEPLDYVQFANLQDRSYMIMTDSGGLQEEAPALGKPVLVLRKETERPEAIEAGTVKLAGIEEERIYDLASELILDSNAYNAMSNAVNPYGDGHAVENTIKAIKSYYKL
ncbi:UDP-N-acetylglucosamine 2-epimerase (non-hydrolyzing) [Acidaminobacter sp. JC074]|uniref:non-hydrolyzing UDP-N-acetylglucosamine 2-epimerase n=1 Tax=Acidaminobacter sp. JC074 TaxID=2530199 RepID=UPI001F0F2A5C|nr:UDP-N-acetylglucosamine 2-epimerase (non-hydrolyzing) [Acidaminobacter sp. JC074]MCH4889345.1 UDP-N-acetylglucosamine 2-epimerase (non-hydrolyzing) [Acidaminobacter sp. JC074]